MITFRLTESCFSSCGCVTCGAILYIIKENLCALFPYPFPISQSCSSTFEQIEVSVNLLFRKRVAFCPSVLSPLAFPCCVFCTPIISFSLYKRDKLHSQRPGRLDLVLFTFFTSFLEILILYIRDCELLACPSPLPVLSLLMLSSCLY